MKFIDNKYTKLYFSIIENAQKQDRKKSKFTYFEVHHIYPSCIFPELKKIKSNLVNLTSREHFLCHYLLCKMFEENSSEWIKLVRAFTFMNAANNRQESRYFNSRLYELARKHIGHVMSECQAGEKNSQFGKIWIYSDSLQENIKIDASNLEHYLQQGYVKGRKVSWKSDAEIKLDKIEKQIQRLQKQKDQLLIEIGLS